MILPFQGGCACGALRYECSVAPHFMVHCHCRDCQRASGTAFSSALAVPAAAVRINGAVKYHEVRADSGHTARRGFCPDCGCPVFAGNSGSPEFLAIKAGSLDDPSWFKPMGHIWMASAQPWAHPDPQLPQFPGNPMLRPPPRTPDSQP